MRAAVNGHVTLSNGNRHAKHDEQANESSEMSEDDVPLLVCVKLHITPRATMHLFMIRASYELV